MYYEANQLTKTQTSLQKPNLCAPVTFQWLHLVLCKGRHKSSETDEHYMLVLIKQYYTCCFIISNKFFLILFFKTSLTNNRYDI